MKIFILFSAISALVLESDATCNQGAVYACAYAMIQDTNLATQPCAVYNTFLQCIEAYKPECQGTPFWTQIKNNFQQTEQICRGQIPQIGRACNIDAIGSCSQDMLEANNLWTDPCSVYGTFTQCIQPYEDGCQGSDMWTRMQSQMQTLERICG